jgi:hypothetical protein
MVTPSFSFDIKTVAWGPGTASLNPTAVTSKIRLACPLLLHEPFGAGEQ